jgi:hypothetical protein
MESFWSAWSITDFISVYAELRSELWGEALAKFQKISYVHGRRQDRKSKAVSRDVDWALGKVN